MKNDNLFKGFNIEKAYINNSSKDDNSLFRKILKFLFFNSKYYSTEEDFNDIYKTDEFNYSQRIFEDSGNFENIIQFAENKNILIDYLRMLKSLKVKGNEDGFSENSSADNTNLYKNLRALNLNEDNQKFKNYRSTENINVYEHLKNFSLNEDNQKFKNYRNTENINIYEHLKNHKNANNINLYRNLKNLNLNNNDFKHEDYKYGKEKSIYNKLENKDESEKLNAYIFGEIYSAKNVEGFNADNKIYNNRDIISENFYKNLNESKTVKVSSLNLMADDFEFIPLMDKFDFLNEKDVQGKEYEKFSNIGLIDNLYGKKTPHFLKDLEENKKLSAYKIFNLNYKKPIGVSMRGLQAKQHEYGNNENIINMRIKEKQREDDNEKQDVREELLSLMAENIEPMLINILENEAFEEAESYYVF